MKTEEAIATIMRHLEQMQILKIEKINLLQDLLLKSDYFGTKSNEKIYFDLQDSLRYTDEIEKPSRNDSKLNATIELRNALAKKRRLRVRGYTNGEYLYMLTDGSLTLKYKTYTRKSLDDALEA